MKMTFSFGTRGHFFPEGLLANLSTYKLPGISPMQWLPTLVHENGFTGLGWNAEAADSVDNLS